MGSVNVGDDLHPAGLAPSAGVDLRLDHGASAQVGRRLAGLLGRLGNLSLGDRHAVTGQQGFGLVLVEFHETPRLNLVVGLARKPRAMIVNGVEACPPCVTAVAGTTHARNALYPATLGAVHGVGKRLLATYVGRRTKLVALHDDGLTAPQTAPYRR